MVSVDNVSHLKGDYSWNYSKLESIRVVVNSHYPLVSFTLDVLLFIIVLFHSVIGKRLGVVLQY